MEIVSTVDTLLSRGSQLRQRLRNVRSAPDELQDIRQAFGRNEGFLKAIKDSYDPALSLPERVQSSVEQYLQHVETMIEHITSKLSKLEKRLSYVPNSNLDEDKRESVTKTRKVHSKGRFGKKNFRKITKNFVLATKTKEMMTSINSNLKTVEQKLLMITGLLNGQFHQRSTSKQVWIPYFPSFIHEKNVVLDFNSLDDNDEHTTVEGKLKHILLSAVKKKVSSSGNVKDISLQKPIILSVRGNGGTGKTVALESLCEQADVREIFEDGIHYITMGIGVTSTDVIRQISLCMKRAGLHELSRELKDTSSIREAVGECSNALKRKKILIVVDDVCPTETSENGQFEDLMKLMNESNQGAIVFSTRNSKLANLADHTINCDYLDPRGPISRQLFWSHAQITTADVEDLEEDLLDLHRKEELGLILDTCGGIKLCLAIAGAWLAEEQIEHQSCSFSSALINLSRKIDPRNLIRETSARHGSLCDVLRGSLLCCDRLVAKRKLLDKNGNIIKVLDIFVGLCVLRRQKWTPLSTVQALFGLERSCMEQICRQLSRQSLISIRQNSDVEDSIFNIFTNEESDSDELFIFVHDLILEICCLEASEKGGSKIWHRRLLNGHIEPNKHHALRTSESTNAVTRDGNCREWWDLENVINSMYLFRNVIWHLLEGELWNEAWELLTDVRWTICHLRKNAWLKLEEELNLMIDMHEKFTVNRKASENLITKDQVDCDGLLILRNNLRGAWVHIACNEEALGFEAFSRLSDFASQHSSVDRFLHTVKEYGPRLSLRPLTSIRQVTDSREESCSYLGDPASYSYQMMELSSDKMYVFVSNQPGTFNTFNLKTNTCVPSVLFPMLVLLQEMTESDDDDLQMLFRVGFQIASIRDMWSENYIQQWMTFAVSANEQLISFVLPGERLFVYEESTEGKPYELLCEESIRFVTSITGLVFSKTSKLLAWTSADHTIQVYDIRSHKFVAESLSGHSGRPLSLAFSEDDCFLVSGDENGELLVWDLEADANACNRLAGHNSETVSVAFNDCTTQVVVGYRDGVIQIWDLVTGAQLCDPFNGHNDRIFFAEFCGNGSRILSGCEDGSVRTWRVEKQNNLIENDRYEYSPASCGGFSPDGMKAIVGYNNGTVQIWSTDEGKPCTKPFQIHEEKVTGVFLHSNGKCALSSSEDGTIRKWATDTGENLIEPLCHDSGVLACCSGMKLESIISILHNKIYQEDFKTKWQSSIPLTEFPLDAVFLFYCPLSGGNNTVIKIRKDTHRAVNARRHYEIFQKVRKAKQIIESESKCISTGTGKLESVRHAGPSDFGIDDSIKQTITTEVEKKTATEIENTQDVDAEENENEGFYLRIFDVDHVANNLMTDDITSSVTEETNDTLLCENDKITSFELDSGYINAVQASGECVRLAHYPYSDPILFQWHEKGKIMCIDDDGKLFIGKVELKNDSANRDLGS